MSDSVFPQLDHEAIADTRNGMHAYARVLGDCLKACRTKRKHWWHASLRPSLNGLSTGIVRATTDFEIELDFSRTEMHARSAVDTGFDVALGGQSAAETAAAVGEFMSVHGIGQTQLEQFGSVDRESAVPGGFSATQAEAMGRALRGVATAMERFRAGIEEETSPVQLWPHHFDLSMIWLPGERIPGQDPADEEYSDKQMNFGFAFGDAGIPEPYFYVTAYPMPDAMAGTPLPSGAQWKTDGFTGAVLTYRSLRDSGDPPGYLQDLWTGLLATGRQHMLEKND